MIHPMIDEAVPEALRQQLVRLDGQRVAFAGIAAPVLESFLGRLRVELTCASNAIEGNTLSLRETPLVVEEKLAPGEGKTLRDTTQCLVVEVVERSLDLAAGITTGQALSELALPSAWNADGEAPLKPKRRKPRRWGRGIRRLETG